MSTITVTTKSREQIAADFEAVFKAIEPPVVVKPVTLQDRLAPYRKEIQKQRRRGLTWKQIAVGMSDPRINEKVSPSTLLRFFGAKPASPASAKPPRIRLIRDPATDKPITPSPAAGATPPPRQRLILDPVTGKPLPPRPPAA